MRILFVFILSYFACLAQTPAPIISIDNTHHDFGKMSPGKVVLHTFNVSNKGNASLRITEIRESCATCSNAVIAKRNLEPGESTTLAVRFNTSGMLGNVQKSIAIFSNDPVNPRIDLTLGAGVVKEVMPSRSIIFFNEVSRYTSYSSTVRLESGNKQNIELTNIIIPVPYLSCETQIEGSDVILTININGQLIPKQSNNGRDTITVYTTSEEVPTLPLIIQWDTLPIVTVSPKRIAWSGNAGQHFENTVTLTHSGEKAFRILDTKTTSPHVQVLDIPKISATNHKFSIVMSTEAGIGMYYEKVTLILDDPEQSEVEINVATVLR